MRKNRLKRIISATVIMTLLFSAAHITAFAVDSSTSIQSQYEGLSAPRKAQGNTEYKTGYYRTNANMRVRSTPDTSISTNILTLIDKGTEVKITKVDGVWGYLTYGKYTGWMSLEYSIYLRPLETEPDPPDDPVVVTPPTELPANVKFLVADISRFNETSDFNWSRMKAAGLEAVIIRIGGRGYSTHEIYSDKLFYTHYKNAKAAGLHVGAYFFSYALTEAEAVEEAQYAINTMRQYGCEMDMPVFIDIEDYTESDHWDEQHIKAGKAACSAVVNAFCNEIAAAGYYPGIYCNKWFGEQMLYASVFTGRAVWIAQYGASLTKCSFNGRVDMWQYTGSGTLSGYKGYIDLNYCYVDFPSYINSNGTSGHYGDHKIDSNWTVTTTPTCTEEGQRKKTCTDCGKVLLSETMRKAGHSSGSKYVLPYETSVSPGDVLTSSVKNKLHSEKAGDYSTYYDIYTNTGGTLLTYCVDCGKVLTVSYSYGDTTHSKLKTETVDATCTKEGVTKTVCGDCGKTISASIIPYAEHMSGSVTLKNVSCTTEGTRYTACSVCGKNIRTEYVAKLDHTYDTGVLKPAPTLKTTGSKIYTCTRCGATKTETVPCPKYGDADGDGQVTASDARIAIRAAVGLEELSVIAKTAADINHSGKIESDDARYILRISVELDKASELMNKYY